MALQTELLRSALFPFGVSGRCCIQALFWTEPWLALVWSSALKDWWGGLELPGPSTSSGELEQMSPQPLPLSPQVFLMTWRWGWS